MLNKRKTHKKVKGENNKHVACLYFKLHRTDRVVEIAP